MIKYFISTIMMAAFLASSLLAVESAVEEKGPSADSIHINADEITPSAISLPTDSNTKTEKTRVPKKSLKKAFFMSLLLPGSGEYYAGAKTQAKAFLGAEAMIWSFAAFCRPGPTRNRPRISTTRIFMNIPAVTGTTRTSGPRPG